MDSITHEIGNKILVDRSRLNSLSTEALQLEMAKIYSVPDREVVFIDSLAKMFNKASLVNAIETGSGFLPVILENFGIDESPVGSLAIIKAYLRLKQRILDKYHEACPKISYPFIPVPNGWSINKHLIINDICIKRKNNNNDYKIGIKTAKKIWDRMAPFWAGGSKPEYFTVSASGYNNNVYAHSDKVSVGCQEIQRYELEQVALHFGWDIPSVPDVES